MYKNRTGKGKPRVELLRERIKALTTRIKPGSPSPIPVPGSLHIVTTRTEPVPPILSDPSPRTKPVHLKLIPMLVLKNETG